MHLEYYESEYQGRPIEFALEPYTEDPTWINITFLDVGTQEAIEVATICFAEVCDKMIDSNTAMLLRARRGTCEVDTSKCDKFVNHHKRLGRVLQHTYRCSDFPMSRKLACYVDYSWEYGEWVPYLSEMTQDSIRKCYN